MTSCYRRSVPQHVLPAAAFPTLNSDNCWGSDTFCINESWVSACTSRSTSGGMCNGGIPLQNNQWCNLKLQKMARWHNTRRRTEQVKKMPPHLAVTLQLVPCWESHHSGANDDDYRSITRGRLFLEAAPFFLEQHCRQAARSFFFFFFQQRGRAQTAFYSSSSMPNMIALFFMVAPAFLSTTWGVSWAAPLEVAAPLLLVGAEAERVFRVTVQMQSSTQLFQATAVGLSQYVGFRGTAGESVTAHI